jgi:hypothetical protein
MPACGIRLFSNRGKSKSEFEYPDAAVTFRGGDDTLAVERRNGRLYLAGLTVSVIGDTAMSLAAGIWLKSLTGSSSEAALCRCASTPRPWPGRWLEWWPTGCAAAGSWCG